MKTFFISTSLTFFLFHNISRTVSFTSLPTMKIKLMYIQGGEGDIIVCNMRRFYENQHTK